MSETIVMSMLEELQAEITLLKEDIALLKSDIENLKYTFTSSYGKKD